MFTFAACQSRSSTASGRGRQLRTATVEAPDGFSVLTGGGGCDRGSIAESGPIGLTKWRVECQTGRATAKAVVCPLQ
jgi:hypothetical protein